ncbi:MAG TPA: GNAT family N-acetyltransferase [Tepidiformaceae bacterium]|nr:GNAT family N-acetyltransferase [Tepidiformaceae bacterium]
MTYAAPDRPKTLLRDGRTMAFRPIAPDDGPRLCDHVARSSAESRRLRFFKSTSRLDPNFADRLAEVDHRRRCAFVGHLCGDDAIRAVGRYEATAPGEAEIAFLIEDEFQGHGLGRELFELLAENAARNGIKRFTAMVLPENRKMIGMFERMGRPMSVRTDGCTLLVELDLAA